MLWGKREMVRLGVCFWGACNAVIARVGIDSVARACMNDRELKADRNRFNGGAFVHTRGTRLSRSLPSSRANTSILVNVGPEHQEQAHVTFVSCVG
jgi:hypothetical protein